MARPPILTPEQRLRLITTHQAAQQLQVLHKTLEGYRSKGQYPELRWERIGGRVFYDAACIRRHLERRTTRTIESTPRTYALASSGDQHRHRYPDRARTL